MIFTCAFVRFGNFHLSQAVDTLFLNCETLKNYDVLVIASLGYIGFLR